MKPKQRYHDNFTIEREEDILVDISADIEIDEYGNVHLTNFCNDVEMTPAEIAEAEKHLIDVARHS